MKRYVAVFRSRTDVLSFIYDLNSLGATAHAVETPKQTAVGCGISAEFSINELSLALKLIKFKGYQSFFGVFKYEKRGGKVIVERI